MRVAFSIWEERIATVFDCCRLICLVRFEDGVNKGESRVSLQSNLPVQRAVNLADMGVNSLVCGAISREFHSLLAARQIEVIPFVSGDLRLVVQAYIDGRLEDGSFLMPGCYRHGRHGFMTAAELSEFRHRGCGAGPIAAGPEGYCVCPDCGFRVPHVRGVPCVSLRCAKCGAMMSRGLD